MRRLLIVSALVIASCSVPSKTGISIGKHRNTDARQGIINGTLDANGDPSVVELYYITSSGGGTCTGELIGPHTVMTAGHCTDLTAGGELSGQGGPTLVPCTTTADAEAVANGQTPSSRCNLATFVIFNNTCTTNDTQGSCESNLISSGDFIVADQLVNPGYNANASTGNDNDIGLLHLISNTLYNGNAEPPLLTFNRQSEGSQCDDLGNLTFVGFGITSGNGQISGVRYKVSHDAKVHDTWHNEEDGPGASQWGAYCPDGTTSEPTCSGDSGGPSFDSSGVIVAVTSLGDNNCSAYGQDTRTDAHASWIDSTMTGWSDPVNGTTTGSTSSTTSSTSGTTTSSTSSTSSTSGTTSSGSTTTTGGTTGSSAGECGACPSSGNCTNGGICVTDANNNNVCTGGTCTSDNNCASGSSCFSITDNNNNPIGNYCFPTSQACSTTTTSSGSTGSTTSTTTSATTSGSTSSTSTSTTTGATSTTGGSTSTTSSSTTSSTTGGTTSSSTTTSGGSTTGVSTTGGSSTTSSTTTSGGSTGASGLASVGECVSCATSTCANGGTCLTDGHGAQVCSGKTCSVDADCASGDACFPMSDANNNPIGRFCFPTTQTCAVVTNGSGTSGSTGSKGASSGGCASAEAGDLLLALLGLAPLLRRRRR